MGQRVRRKAAAGINAFVAGEETLHTAAAIIANKIDEAYSGLSQVKREIPQPGSHARSFADLAGKAMGTIMPSAGIKGVGLSAVLGNHDSAEQQARTIMNYAYRPVLLSADTNVATLSAPVNPLTGNAAPTNAGPSGVGGGARGVGGDHVGMPNVGDAGVAAPGTSAAGAAPIDATSGNSFDSGGSDASGPGKPGDGGGFGKTGVGAGPGATVAAGYSPSGGGAGGAFGGGGGLNSPGLDVENNQRSWLRDAQPRGGVSAGRTGMPGMGGMPPGGKGKRDNDDELEHTTPDYLITEENGKKLLGSDGRRVGPPVLGVWDENGHHVR